MEEDIREAYEKGKAAGLTEGYELAASELHSLVRMLGQMGQKLMEKKENLLAELKPELLDISIEIAEKFLRTELASPKALMRNLEMHLMKASSWMQGESVSLYLSPEDHEQLRAHLTTHMHWQKELKSLSLLPDTSLLRGDFRIESPKSLIRFSLERELRHLKNEVLKVGA